MTDLFVTIIHGAIPVLGVPHPAVGKCLQCFGVKAKSLIYSIMLLPACGPLATRDVAVSHQSYLFVTLLSDTFV